MTEPIFLASASPRRRELLDQIRVVYTVFDVPAPPGEDEPRMNGESPLAYVTRTALDKARRAVEWARASDNAAIGNTRVLLTADTTVALGDEILAKPADAADAARLLTRLSGKTHVVHTAVVVVAGGATLKALSTSQVTFSVLSPEDIDAYVASGEPFGKAGAYGIQGMAARFISRINGSYSGVMGLPLFETARLLEQTNDILRKSGAT